jgi:hypothetical protein
VAIAIAGNLNLFVCHVPRAPIPAARCNPPTLHLSVSSSSPPPFCTTSNSSRRDPSDSVVSPSWLDPLLYYIFLSAPRPSLPFSPLYSTLSASPPLFCTTSNSSRPDPPDSVVSPSRLDPLLYPRYLLCSWSARFQVSVFRLSLLTAGLNNSYIRYMILYSCYTASG